MPNSSNRYGAPTCASRVSSSNTSAAWTIWWRSSTSSGPGLGDGWVCSSTTWSQARRRPGSPSAVRRGPGGAHTLVVGHPFIDIWQAVKPARIGVSAWPVIPKGVDWKKGVCSKLGWPHAQQADIARAWQRIRSRVRDWNDLEPALIGRVEELIDFVTQPAGS